MYSQTPLAEQILRPATNAESNAALHRLSMALGVAGAGLIAPGRGWIESSGAPLPAMPSIDAAQTCGFVRSRDERGLPCFLAAAPIATLWAGPQYWLVLWDDHPRGRAEAGQILSRTTELAAHVALDRILAAERYRQRLFERASAIARIGIWACRLPSQTLVWSDGVYDLFELPRGVPVTRDMTLAMYLPESRREMEAVRREAIQTRGDFTFDAQIVTAKGNPRWIRITAAVESRGGDAVSIFGMKQDVTEEKALMERTRRIAETDALTGLANRGLFQQKLDALDARSGAALMLVDLDNFKAINDSLGHAAGDTSLKETAQRLRACCGEQPFVSRIGGDEFALLLPAEQAQDAYRMAESILDAMRAPLKFNGEVRDLSASVGIAFHRGESADALYRNADTALYAAKSAGRNTWRAFD